MKTLYNQLLELLKYDSRSPLTWLSGGKLEYFSKDNDWLIERLANYLEREINSILKEKDDEIAELEERAENAESETESLEEELEQARNKESEEIKILYEILRTHLTYEERDYLNRKFDLEISTIGGKS